jgi:3-oxoacyl-[acyl-carrier protein] reductase
MDLDLAGRSYIVTGGSTGLGRATAEALVAEGARVVVVARDADRLAAAVEGLGHSAVGHVGDLSDPTLAPDVVRVALQSHDRLDGGLISVGGPPGGTVMSTTDEQWQSAFASVFLGTVRMMRCVCNSITQDDRGPAGSVAVVLSTSAIEVFTGLSTSNGLRPGLGMLVKDLADEVGPSGIRVNGLLPGRIATDRLRHLDETTGDPDAARARASATIPLRRYGTPAEFGRVAAFVLSPAAGYLTGSLLRVDGGSSRSL